ncbi:MAG: hypothetical protein L6Q84_35625 [Polyangiaceae bacterium]|nr:hypothetical protein [Polyangiaceae bacterium]
MSRVTCGNCAANDIALADHRLSTTPRSKWRRELMYLVGDLYEIGCRLRRIDREVRALARRNGLPEREVEELLGSVRAGLRTARAMRRRRSPWWTEEHIRALVSKRSS